MKFVKMKKMFLVGLCSLFFTMMFLVMPVYAEEAEPTESETESEEVQLISELSDFKIELRNGTSYTYTGKAIVPEIVRVVFTDKEGQTVESTEVKVVEYLNNIKIGKATAVISIEGYEGTVTIQDAFEIVFGNVTSMKSTPAYNKTKISWNKVTGADGYVIYRSTKSSSGFKPLKTITTGTTTSYNDTSVKMGTTYYYKMRAYRLVNGKKVYSAYTKVIKQRAQVATATISSVKKASYNSIKITWGKISGASGYAIYRSTSSKGTYEKIGTAKGGSTLNYIDKNRSCGVTYYYKVAAYRTSSGKNYYGSKSAYMSAKTTPNKGAFTSSTMAGETQATLYWKKSLGASGYTIYRSTEKNFGYSAIKHITKATTLKWIDTGLETEQVYYYKIRPYVLRNGEKIYGSYSAIFKKELLSVKFESIRKYITVQYRLGGTSTSGWDCSGFTQWAMRYLYGIEIDKSSSSQAAGGKAVSKTDQSKWKAGDILVYASNGRVNHVALYLGNGEIMHALNSKYDTLIQNVNYYENWDKKNNLRYVRRYY